MHCNTQSSQAMEEITVYLNSSTAVQAALVKSEVNNEAVEITFLQFMLVGEKKSPVIR